MAACVGVLVAARAAGPALRVIGGRDAVVGEFPYVVKLGPKDAGNVNINATCSRNETFIAVGCTGSVLTATWVLTAAHCYENFKYNNETKLSQVGNFVRYGFALGKESNSDGLSKIFMAITPPQGREGWGHSTNDIALLNTEPILIDRYAQISAIDYTSLYGHEVTLAGFGIMVLNSSNFALPNMLHKPLQVMKAMLRSCKKLLYPTMCALPACGQSQIVALADSGSAVLHPSGVVAVVSRGNHYSFLELIHPSSYKTSLDIAMQLTPVSPYLDWIVNTIKQESSSNKLTNKQIKEDSRRQRMRDNEMAWSGTDIL